MLLLRPTFHGRSTCQALPTAVCTTETQRSRRIDDMVTYLRVGRADTAVQPSIQHQPCADTGADRHQNEALGTFPRTPRPFTQCSSIGVVLNGYTDSHTG